MKIILGSQSPYRARMLEEMGIEFEVMAADIDEKAIRSEDPKELVSLLAKAKAEALLPRIRGEAILITSDEIVMSDGRILEKPSDEEEARRFLENYNTFPAETVTAVCVINLKNGKSASDVDVAKVYFNRFSAEDIDDIIAGGEVYRLSGGFSVDGEKWEKHIKYIEGARDSVIGLPKDVTRRLLNQVSL